MWWFLWSVFIFHSWRFVKLYSKRASVLEPGVIEALIDETNWTTNRRTLGNDKIESTHFWFFLKVVRALIVGSNNLRFNYCSSVKKQVDLHSWFLTSVLKLICAQQGWLILLDSIWMTIKDAINYSAPTCLKLLLNWRAKVMKLLDSRKWLEMNVFKRAIVSLQLEMTVRFLWILNAKFEIKSYTDLPVK